MECEGCKFVRRYIRDKNAWVVCMDCYLKFMKNVKFNF